jgi:RHH-type proline utilization regulon transcriptional repressor/proline dehydrogenase/delta 1-pyrroline-5-carboxylate dehydrogenase
VLASFAPDCPDDWRGQLDRLTDSWGAGIEIFEETDEDLIARLDRPHVPRVRYAERDRVPAAVREAAAKTGEWLADAPILSEGLIELLWYLREQSISYDYHRYGNLGNRATEERRPLLPAADDQSLDEPKSV